MCSDGRSRPALRGPGVGLVGRGGLRARLEPLGERLPQRRERLVLRLALGLPPGALLIDLGAELGGLGLLALALVARRLLLPPRRLELGGQPFGPAALRREQARVRLLQGLE